MLGGWSAMPIVEGHSVLKLVHRSHRRRSVHVTDMAPLLGLRMWRLGRLRVRHGNRRAAVGRQVMGRWPVGPRIGPVLCRPFRYSHPRRAGKRGKRSHGLRRWRGDSMSSHRYRCLFRRRGRRGRRRSPQRLRLAVGLVTLVALELPLLDELLRLGAKVIVIPICQVLPLVVINRPPFGADVDAACDANVDAEVLGTLDTICLIAAPVVRCPVGCLGRRGGSSGACGGQDSRTLGGCCNHVRLSDSTGDRVICLLEVLGIQLQRVETLLVDNITHAVDYGLCRNMLFTP